MPSRVTFKAEDIWDTPDDGNRYEVIGGDLYMTPPPLDAHQAVVTALSAILWEFVRRHRLGHVRVAPFGVVLDASNGLQPDVVFISNARSRILSTRGAEGAPDLVIEVLSPSTASTDRGLKMRRYATSGVEHYWIVDPTRHTIQEYMLGNVGMSLHRRPGPLTSFIRVSSPPHSSNTGALALEPPLSA
ncbi:MAG: Uma2 family endonuclease [Chloroflexota bacterium]